MKISTLVLLALAAGGGYMVWREWKNTEARIQQLRPREQTPLVLGGNVKWNSSLNVFESPTDIYQRLTTKKYLAPLRGNP